tara:strand:- start:934 stop:2262 length:1329 start_codon:yes stop_codon:yes gene_type:complete
MSDKIQTKPLPLDLYDNIEWRQVDVFVPARENYDDPFFGATVNMLAPFHKESGKPAYFFRYGIYKSYNDVRMKLYYKGKQYYNSVALAYKLFPDSNFIKVENNKVYVLKLLDHKISKIFDCWKIKIDSEESLRLATIAENKDNQDKRKQKVTNLYRYNHYYLVNFHGAKKHFAFKEYGGVTHAKFAALKFLKKSIEKKDSKFLENFLKVTKAQIVTTEKQVKKLESKRHYLNPSFVTMEDLNKARIKLNKQSVPVSRAWYELIEEFKIRSSIDINKFINKILSVKLFNKKAKTGLANIDHTNDSFRYKFDTKWKRFSTSYHETALDAIYDGLQLRERLCAILGVKVKFHLTDQQIKDINEAEEIFLLSCNQKNKMRKKNNKHMGRELGSKGFVDMDMKTLNDYFGAKQLIPVRRVWAEEVKAIFNKEIKSEVGHNKLEYDEK